MLIVNGDRMFKNYIKSTYRNFTRNKFFSFINIFSLALGFAVCIIISLWVSKEFSYDKFHQKSDRIFRVERELFRENLYSRWPIVGGKYKQALLDDFPEIENATRIWSRTTSIKDFNNFSHTQSLYAADNAIFQIFDFNLVQGNEQNSLNEPNTLVLTKELAIKYFNTEDVVDKNLTLDIEGEPVDFKITGILADVPKNSHIDFKMLMSITTYPEERFGSWRSNYLYTYILVKDGTAIDELEGKLKSFVENHLEAHYGDLLAQGFEIHKVLKMHLFPITEIHLNPSEHWELQVGGNAFLVYIFISIAILILIIACINYINLTTAGSIKRSREISIRKTVGADKNQIKYQLLLESILYVVIALIIAFAINIFLVPIFEKIFQETLSMTYSFSFKNILIMGILIVVIGLVAGIYPALHLSKYEPVFILSGLKNPTSKGAKFKQNMVIIQFSISIFLIIGILAVSKQINFIRNHNLGFDQENMIVLPARSEQVLNNYNAFKNELKQYPQIISSCRISDLPGEIAFSTTNFRSETNPEQGRSMIIMGVDYDFIPTFQMKMLSGRNFSQQFGSDTSGSILLNETAAKLLGWKPETAINQNLTYGRNSLGNVVGVVDDFHLKSVHFPIEPIALILAPEWVNKITVRIAQGNVPESIALIEKSWKNVYSEEQFEFTFLDDNIKKLYERERKLHITFNIFTIISLVVASLGILGLAIYTSESKIKEIGIRKILGASFMEIILLFNKKLMIWVLISNIIAWPIAWISINKWLQNFVYRISLNIYIFLYAALIALLIALLTTSYHSIKSALANPVESLKYE